jgi:hypothetical protein
MRIFVQLDADGNVTATLESQFPPGEDRQVIPDAHIEVTDRDQDDWSVLRWNGTDFEARTDLE